VARSDGPGGAGPLRPVAKLSVGKPGRGGRKWAVRHRDEHGVARVERIRLSPATPGPGGRLLLMPLVRDGIIVGREPLSAAVERHRQVLTELPPQAFQLSRGDPAIPSVFAGG
jgi:nicotinate phosphoribosyltransferase